MKVTLQPAILEWARDRALLTEAELAKKLGAKVEQVEQWEQDGILTYKRAEKLAKVAHIPFGYLFFSTPPQEKLPVTDFRTVGSVEGKGPSPELLDVIYDAQRKQSWYREHMLDMGADKLEFIGSINVDEAVNNAARSISKHFDFEVSRRTHSKTWEDALRMMFQHCEKAGVLVLRSGVAEGNTRRPLQVSEFRGFALTDDYAPLIFLNSKDSPAAQMFTLVHEVVHLWLGVSGVSNLEKTYASASHRKVEQFCNQTAAEILVPLEQLKTIITSTHLDFMELRRHFKVSKLVILRRLKDLGKLDQKSFEDYYTEEENEFLRKRAQMSGGGDYYATQKARVSTPFAKALIGSTLEGKTLYREAYKLLGIKKTNTFNRFAKELHFSTD